MRNYSQFQFDENLAWKQIEKLSVKIGARFPGSDAEKRAAAHIAAYFNSLGLVVRQEKFRVLSYECQEYGLKAMSPRLGKINCVPMGFSASTPKGGIEAETVFINKGEHVDENSNLTGKILIIYSGLSRERYALVMKKSPAGLIVIDRNMTQPAHTHFNPETREISGGVPTIRVSFMDGHELIKQKIKVVKMIVRFREEMMVSQNVIAEIRGTDRPDEIIVICGHYCSTFDIPGAGDNAAGAAIMMELARVFSKKKPRRTFRFIAFGAEEITCRGSMFHAQQLAKRPDEASKIKLCFNFDEHGSIFGENTAFVFGPPELKASISLLAKECGWETNIEEGMLADDTMFAKIGVPVMALRRQGAQPLHTQLDSMEFLSAKQIGEAGRLAEMWLVRYAAEPDVFPFEHKLPGNFEEKFASWKEYYKTILEPVTE